MSEMTLNGLLETVWTHLVRGKADRRHPARHPTLATIGADGPEMRTLVLRDVDRGAATLDLHTDAQSPKHAQIIADPRVALHVWLPAARLQIRLRARAAILPGDPAVFARLPPEAQANYAGNAPGAPLDASVPIEDPGTRFACIRCQITAIDALLLDEPHRRARFVSGDGWTGQWIAP